MSFIQQHDEEVHVVSDLEQIIAFRFSQYDAHFQESAVAGDPVMSGKQSKLVCNPTLRGLFVKYDMEGAVINRVRHPPDLYRIVSSS